MLIISVTVANNGVKYKRIKILQVYTDDKNKLLTLDILRANGLKGNLQCAMMLDKNKELYDYINKVERYENEIK